MEKLYNFQQTESDIQKFWQEKKTYSFEYNFEKIYSIDTPPPTISGSLHIGHIFSYTQTDIIARYKRMNGYSVFYPFGFDDNGLPTERYVEKKRKISSTSISKSEFIKICLEETQEAEKKFKELWQRIGLSADWTKCYSTISDEVRKISQESFIRLFKQGYIYRKKEPALYCTTCHTSVAQAELDDKEIGSTFNDIIFQTNIGQNLTISTTRPELLVACVALVYNPNDSRYKNLKDSKAIVPIYNYEVPIFEDELVDIQKGTGLVMICTFGDKNDITWYKKFNLPYKQAINYFGKFSEITGPLQGLKLHDARKKILEILKEKNLLINQKPITHFVNVHERCKNEIEYIEIAQWFVKILEYKNEFLKLENEINWYPAFMKSRYNNWVQNISWDWCISRQRNFGISFPVWYCFNCNEIILADIQDLPVDPEEKNIHEKMKGKKCPKCRSEKLIPDSDVMDTWNTSSLSPMICYNLINDSNNNVSLFDNLNLKKFLPMSVRPQAHDIIRTWAFYTIVKSWMHNKEIPWKNLIVSGHVLSPIKEKISKSQANESTTPENLLSRYSSDAIRFWTASGTLGHDISFSEAQIKIGQKLINKLWNAFRFINEHVTDFNLNEPEKISLVDEWLLTKISETFEQYKNYFEQNEFSLALLSIEKFFWQNFCDNYLEIIKDQLFNPDKYNENITLSTKWTLYNVGLWVLQLYAPFIPFITEAIYELLYKEKLNILSIHQTKFLLLEKNYKFEKSVYLVEKIINLISLVRKLKSDNQLSLKTEINQLNIFFDDKKLIDKLKNQENLIKGITQAININFEGDFVDKESKLIKKDNDWIANILL